MVRELLDLLRLSAYLYENHGNSSCSCESWVSVSTRNVLTLCWYVSRVSHPTKLHSTQVRVLAFRAERATDSRCATNDVTQEATKSTKQWCRSVTPAVRGRCREIRRWYRSYAVRSVVAKFLSKFHAAKVWDLLSARSECSLAYQFRVRDHIWASSNCSRNLTASRICQSSYASHGS